MVFIHTAIMSAVEADNAADPGMTVIITGMKRDGTVCKVWLRKYNEEIDVFDSPTKRSDAALIDSQDLSQVNIERISVLRFRQMVELRALPLEAFAFEQLSLLALVDCPQLEELSPLVGQLRNLKRLSIRACPKIRTLPTELDQCTNLLEIRILEMHLDHFPAVPHLQNLQTLNFEGTKIGADALWYGLERLLNLQYVQIDDEQRTENLVSLFSPELGAPLPIDRRRDANTGWMANLFDGARRLAGYGPIRFDMTLCCFSHLARWFYIHRPVLLELCMGLESLELPAYVTYTIFLFTHHWLEYSVNGAFPMHLAWALITGVKHRELPGLEKMK